MINRQHAKSLRAPPLEHFGWTDKKFGRGFRNHGNPVVVIIGFRFKHSVAWQREASSGHAEARGKKGQGKVRNFPNYFSPRRGAQNCDSAAEKFADRSEKLMTDEHEAESENTRKLRNLGSISRAQRMKLFPGLVQARSVQGDHARVGVKPHAREHLGAQSQFLEAGIVGNQFANPGLVGAAANQ